LAGLVIGEDRSGPFYMQSNFTIKTWINVTSRKKETYLCTAKKFTRLIHNALLINYLQWIINHQILTLTCCNAHKLKYIDSQYLRIKWMIFYKVNSYDFVNAVLCDKMTCTTKFSSSCNL